MYKMFIYLNEKKYDSIFGLERESTKEYNVSKKVFK